MPSYYERVTEMLKLERPRSQPPGPVPLAGKSGVIKSALKWAVISLALAAVLTYIGDYGWLRYRIASGRAAYGVVAVSTDYAIHQKNGKTEFQMSDPQSQTCVNSIFPHQGMSPCWYLRRHPEKQIDI